MKHEARQIFIFGSGPYGHVGNIFDTRFDLSDHDFVREGPSSSPVRHHHTSVMTVIRSIKVLWHFPLSAMTCTWIHSDMVGKMHDAAAEAPEAMA